MRPESEANPAVDTNWHKQSQWISDAVSHNLLEDAQAAQILLESKTKSQFPLQIVQGKFANLPSQLDALEKLLLELSDEHELSESTPEPAAQDENRTIAAGRSSRGRKSQPKNAANVQAKSPAPQQVTPPALDEFSTLGAGVRQGKNSHHGQGSPSHRGITARASESAARLAFDVGPERYHVSEEVGRGGCGVVHKARDLQFERSVVLKQILEDHANNDEVVQRFVNEARITAQLEHPGVVPVHEMGVNPDGSPFFAMKEVRGETLAKRISEVHQQPRGHTKDLATRKLLDRFLSVCQTLAFAHRAGVIHRDIKPANVMVGEFGETVILDWGLARRLDSESGVSTEELEGEQNSTKHSADASHSRNHAFGKTHPKGTTRRSGLGIRKPARTSEMTQQGTVLGTAAYMSPEQARGLNSQVGRSSDVFSLGVMLYEILSGRTPFSSDSLQDTLELVAECRYRPLRESSASIPRPLAAICDKAMQPEKDARYAHAGELADDLHNFLSGGSVSVYREKPWERFDRAANNNRTLFRSIFLFAILLAVVSVIAAARIKTAHHLEKIASREATIAKQKAESALAYEKEARLRVQNQLVSSRQAADNWLLELSGDLQFYPGLESISHELISEGIAHYRQLSEYARIDWEKAKHRRDEGLNLGELEIADLHSEYVSSTLRLADLTRLSGNLTEAEALYIVAESEARVALDWESSGNEREFEMHLQLANARIGLMLAGNLDANQSAARAQVMQLANSLRGLVAKQPTHGGARNALSRAVLTISRQLGEAEQELAAKLLDEAVQHSVVLGKQEPNRKNLSLRGTVMEERARTLFKNAKYDAAVEACKDLILHYDQMLEGSPERPDLLESQSVGLSLLGSCYLEQSKSFDARSAYDKASAKLEKAWEQLYGEGFYRENRAILLQNLSGALYAQGKFSDAEKSLRDSIEQQRWLIEQDGVNTTRIRRIAVSYQALARLLNHKQAPESTSQEEIGDLLKNARQLVEHLVAQKCPDNLLLCEQYLLEFELAIQTNRPETVTATFHQVVSLLDLGQDIPDAAREFYLGELACMKLRLDPKINASDLPTALQHLENAIQSRQASVRDRAFERQLTLLCTDTSYDKFAKPETKEAKKALEVARAWQQASNGSAAAWHWSAIALMLNNRPSDAEQALAKSIAFRGGQSSPEDDLIEAALLLSQNSDNANSRANRALSRVDKAEYLFPHAIGLEKLVRELLLPPSH